MQDLHEKIDELSIKYADNEYVLSRLRVFILNQLPGLLSSAENLCTERSKRKADLLANGDKFFEEFISIYKYYYCSRLEIFFEYDDVHFSQVSEDDIIHKVLSMITQRPDLQSWKHKIKNNLIKSIKDRSLLNAVPELYTIQSVVGKLYPHFFITKDAAKHFLVAVGDSIKGKKNNIYIAPSSLKPIIREIENNYYNYFGNSNILTNFKLKYHGHEYSELRFFSCNMKNKHPFDITNMLDMLCVASHYSDQYETADNFASKLGDNMLYQNVFFTKQLTIEGLVKNFKENALYELNGAMVKSRSMSFILKKYFDKNNLPTIIFHDAFVNEMKKSFQFDEEKDCYVGVTSSYLPTVSAFCSFWDNHMEEDYKAPELEIDEVVALFYYENPVFKTDSSITTEFIVELLKHHMAPDLIIENEKFIHNIHCDVWDKRLEVVAFFQYLKQTNTTAISLYDVYILYMTWRGTAMKMSKKCFEKLSEEILVCSIDLSGVINTNFWKN
jgi:hypothetical protein